MYNGYASDFDSIQYSTSKIGNIKRFTENSGMGSDDMYSQISSKLSSAFSSLQGSFSSISDRISSYLPSAADRHDDVHSQFGADSRSSLSSYIRQAKTSINSALNRPIFTDTEVIPNNLDLYQRPRSRTSEIIRNCRSDTFKQYARDWEEAADKGYPLSASLVYRNRRRRKYDTEVLSNGLSMYHQLHERLRAYGNSLKQYVTSREEVQSITSIVTTSNVGDSPSDLADILLPQT
ncbi:hypothetical protein DPMN_124803 [Dreissena polymorpha]|uniref:Uncharacterized protein n=1 Tax=Dreissena polymorpha TaxID=45954 RepID=A0A9D4JWJ2_DREPO|nr:hypothetical protein DPMN_124803 [Dreissena polymorpha]